MSEQAQTPVVLHIGAVRVCLYDGYTVTHFPDGPSVDAQHDDMHHVGQDVTGLALGYPDAPSMNRAHDVVHCLLARWVGLRYSPVLRALALRATSPDVADDEEAAVLAIQRLTQALGIDIVAVAQAAAQPIEERS